MCLRRRDIFKPRHVVVRFILVVQKSELVAFTRRRAGVRKRQELWRPALLRRACDPQEYFDVKRQ